MTDIWMGISPGPLTTRILGMASASETILLERVADLEEKNRAGRGLERRMSRRRELPAARVRAQRHRAAQVTQPQTRQRRQAQALTPGSPQTRQPGPFVCPGCSDFFGSGRSSTLLSDGDPKYGTAFDRVADGADIVVIRIAPCTPRMNAGVERFLGGGRRERRDHALILGEPHLRSVLGQYVETCFNTMRPHPGIGQRIPVSTPRQTCNDASKVVAIPVLGGLQHGYRAAA